MTLHTTIIAALVAGAFLLPQVGHAQTAAPAAAPAAPSPFVGNFTLASEYLYRGIAQTRGKPAIQGGFDYAHPSGFYVGTWGSNISWLTDAGASGASLELDIYGG
ncbi:MAG: TorF family putative porin [Pseudomonadota bacterium]